MNFSKSNIPYLKFIYLTYPELFIIRCFILLRDFSHHAEHLPAVFLMQVYSGIMRKLLLEYI